MHGTGRPQCRWVFLVLVTAPKAAAKLALREPRDATSGTKLALHTRNGPFWRVLRVQGELCTAYEVDTKPVDTTTHQAPLVWRTPEGPEGTASVPVGGGRARAGTSATQYRRHRTNAPRQTKNGSSELSVGGGV